MPSVQLQTSTDRRAKTAPKFLGGSAIAREFGVTPSVISRKMRDGQTVEQIRAYYRAQGLGQPDKKEKKDPKKEPKKESPVYQGANSFRPKVRTKPSLPPLPEPDPDDDEEPEIPGWVPGADGQNDFATLNQAKIRKEVALADKHELDLAERRKELIDRHKVQLWVTGMVTRARDMLLRVAPELRDQLAASDDPLECERLVKNAITHALSSLRQFKPETVD